MVSFGIGSSETRRGTGRQNAEVTMTVDADVTPGPSSRPLIAPVWHTVVFIAIFVGLSVAGGFFQHAAKQHPQAAVPSGNAVSRYISVLVFEADRWRRCVFPFPFLCHWTPGRVHAAALRARLYRNGRTRVAASVHCRPPKPILVSVLRKPDAPSGFLLHGPEDMVFYQRIPHWRWILGRGAISSLPKLRESDLCPATPHPE